MSEFLAEASVLIRPDVTKFRALLEEQLLAATRGVAIPIPVIATGAGTAALVESQAVLKTQTIQTTAALTAEADAARLAGFNNARAALQTNEFTASQAQLRKGVIASAASLTGLRGAVLAASPAFLAAVVSVGAFAKSVGLAADLQEELNVFRVTAGATADEMRRVGDEAKQLGADITLPAVSAGDAAEAMTELAKAGLSVEDSLRGARGVLQLSTAGQLDVADATNIAASALNAFGLSGDQALHVADLLANAANKAQGSVGDMGAALVQVASVSRQVGISLDDTVALLALLAKNGIQGAGAGTVLRVALLRLVAPSVAAAKIIDKLNISIRDVNGNIRPDVFAQFATATRDLSNAQRDADAAIVFGTRGIRAQAILGREGAAALTDMAVAVGQAGAAQELAGARTAGFSGKVEALKNSLAALGVSIGSLTLGPLGALIDTMNQVISVFDIAAQQATDSANAISDSFHQVADPIAGVAKDLDRITADAANLPSLADVLGNLTKTRDDAASVADDVSKILKDLKAAGGGTTALNQAAVALQELVERLQKGSPAAQQLATDVEKVLVQLQKGATIPPFKFPDIQVPPALLHGDLGKTVGDSTLSALDAALTGQPAFDVGQKWMSDLAAGAQQKAPEVAVDVAETLTLNLTTKLSVAEATGTQDDVLKILQERRDKLLARLNALQQEPATALIQKKIQNTADLLTATDSKIESILAQQKSASDQIAADIVQARSSADQKIIDAIAGGEQKRRNAALAASTTESLKDDITAQTALRNFFKSKIVQVRKTVQDAKTATSEIASLTADFISANLALADLEKRQAEALKAQRRAVIDRRRENLELNLQIAQATGNKGAQERALKAQISEIEREIRTTRRGSLERKRLILELRQAQASLRDLKKEKDKTKKSTLAAREFEFLQTQQGFVSNLLSNLIPQGATAGLVGGGQGPVSAIQGQRPQQAVAQERTAAQGTQTRGVTVGQGSEQIALLRSILQGIRALNQGSDHPEAKHQRKVGSAIMDNVGGV